MDEPTLARLLTLCELDAGECPVVVIIPRESVGGEDYLKERACALIDVTALVFGHR